MPGAAWDPVFGLRPGRGPLRGGGTGAGPPSQRGSCSPPGSAACLLAPHLGVSPGGLALPSGGPLEQAPLSGTEDPFRPPQCEGGRLGLCSLVGGRGDG